MSNELDAIAESGDLSDYAADFEAGDHTICITKLAMKATREYGKIIELEGIIVESNTAPKGALRGEGFFIERQGDTGMYARKRANALGRAIVKSLGGNPDDRTEIEFNGRKVKKGEKLVADTLGKAIAPTAPVKGLLLRVSSKNRKSKTTGKDHANNTYSEIPQTREQIAAARAKLESAPVATQTAVASAPVTAPVSGVLDGVL